MWNLMDYERGGVEGGDMVYGWVRWVGVWGCNGF